MIKKGAGFRHTRHGSPQTIIKYGRAAPMFGYSPNIDDCPLFQWW